MDECADVAAVGDARSVRPHRYLIDVSEIRDEILQANIVLSSRPCNHLDREITAALDRPPYVVDIRRGSAHPIAVARDMDEDAICHDQMGTTNILCADGIPAHV